MTSISFDSLQFRNNIAARFIETGNYVQAYQNLKMILRDAVETVAQPEESTGPALTHSLDTTTLDINPRKDFDFFSWPVRVFDSSGSTEDDNDENTRTLCAVVLFNAGLACHHLSRSTHQGVIRSNALLQAKDIYLRALSVAKRFGVILALAVKANLMDICLELGDLEGLQYWRAQFNRQVTLHPTDMPDSVFLCFSAMSVYFAKGLVAARAA